MARLKRYCPAGIPVHIIQRGNNRSDCFKSNEDMASFIHYLRLGAAKYDVDIHAWVLMTNHVHFLVTPNLNNAVSRMMQYLGRHYVRYFNQKYSRTGTLWEGRFRSCLVQEENYFLICQRYIELNPVRAGMVDNPADYHWSSYRSNALGIESSFRRPHNVYYALGNTEPSRLEAYRELFVEELNPGVVEAIRFSTNKGLALGSELFKNEIETQGGQPARLQKRGPKSASVA